MLSLSLARPIGLIIRNSFLSGTVPDIWKKAVLTPIPKIPCPVDISHYRPIASTCVVSKIAESFMKEDLEGFFESACIIPSSQHGIRKGRSVLTSLTET
jgi:hypothetical protein